MIILCRSILIDNIMNLNNIHSLLYDLHANFKK